MKDWIFLIKCKSWLASILIRSDLSYSRHHIRLIKFNQFIILFHGQSNKYILYAVGKKFFNKIKIFHDS